MPDYALVISTYRDMSAAELENPSVADGESILAQVGHRKRSRVENWDPIREAFVTRALRPTFEELAVEFSVPRKAIASASMDEGWGVLRADAMNAKLKQAGASELILSALKSSRAIVAAGEATGLLMIQKIGDLMNEIGDGGAPSSRVSMYNTLTFALQNVANAMKSLGIVGFAKELGTGKEDNGKWNPGLLNQINITIKDLASKAEVDNLVESPCSNIPDSPQAHVIGEVLPSQVRKPQLTQAEIDEVI